MLTSQQPGHQLGHFGNELRRDGFREAQFQRFFRRVTRDALHRSVDRGVAPLEVMRVNNVVGVFNQVAIAFLAFAQSGFGLLTRGDVAKYNDRAG